MQAKDARIHAIRAIHVGAERVNLGVNNGARMAGRSERACDRACSRDGEIAREHRVIAEQSRALGAGSQLAPR